MSGRPGQLLRVESRLAPELPMHQSSSMWALLALAMLIPTPATADTVLDCIGQGSAEGFPVTRSGVERMLTVKMHGYDAEAFFRNGGGEVSFCPRHALCQVAVSGEAIEIVARKLPNYDPLYEQTLTVDRSRWMFHAGGGGLDGGWSITGTCKAR